MPDVDKILRLVADGALTPEEADRILRMLEEHAATGAPRSGTPRAGATEVEARHLRIEITEGGRRVINLRVPINVAGIVAGIVPGLADEEAERIRTSIRSGVRGPIVDIGDQDGDRVLIVSK